MHIAKTISSKLASLSRSKCGPHSSRKGLLQQISKYLFLCTQTVLEALWAEAGSSVSRASVYCTLPTLSQLRSGQRGSRGSKSLCLIKVMLKSSYFSITQKFKKKKNTMTVFHVIVPVYKTPKIIQIPPICISFSFHNVNTFRRS